MPCLTIPTPTGPLALTEADGALVAIRWSDRLDNDGDETPLLAEARRQLERYFAGERIRFDLPVRPAGSAFRRAVWRAMQAIPYGEVRTYGDLARDLDNSPRAVGTACGRNPIPVVIPCHRVVGSGGRMVGFSGGKGVDTKRALLTIERAVLL